MRIQTPSLTPWMASHGVRSLSIPQLHPKPCSHHLLQNKLLAGSKHPGPLPCCSQVSDGTTSATNQTNCLQSTANWDRLPTEQEAGPWALGKTETVFILPGNNQHEHQEPKHATKHYFFQALTNKRGLNIAQSHSGKEGNLPLEPPACNLSMQHIQKLGGT